MAYYNLEELRKNEQFCDVHIKVEDKMFPAHRVILSAGSNYFKTMFTSDFVEKQNQTIEIKEISPKALEILLSFIYTNTLNINSENAQELYKAADYLDMTLGKDRCSQFLIETVDENNCIEMFKLGSNLNDICLQHQAKVVISRYLKGMSTNDEFLKFSFNEIQSILIISKVLLYSQDEIQFNAIINWVQFHYEERKIYLHILLRCIQSTELIQHFYNEHLVRDDILCKDWLLDNLNKNGILKFS